MHPHFSVAIQAAKAFKNENLVPSAFVTNSLRSHFALLGMDVLEADRTRGIKISIRENDDSRIEKVTSQVRGHSKACWTSDPRAAHAIRAVARIRCLQFVKRTRQDSEGVEKVDVDASSHAGFKKWAKGLDQFEALCLEIFRSGAVKSKTRSTVCHLCG